MTLDRPIGAHNAESKLKKLFVTGLKNFVTAVFAGVLASLYLVYAMFAAATAQSVFGITILIAYPISIHVVGEVAFHLNTVLPSIHRGHGAMPLTSARREEFGVTLLAPIFILAISGKHPMSWRARYDGFLAANALWALRQMNQLGRASNVWDEALPQEPDWH